MDNFAAVLVVVLEILGGALSVILTALAWKALGKMGIAKTAERDALLRSYVKEGVSRTEAWASKNGKKGSEKLNHALDIVKTLATAAGLKKWADETLVAKIEGQLARNKEENGNGG
jgi:hypothetical protein